MAEIRTTFDIPDAELWENVLDNLPNYEWWMAPGTFSGRDDKHFTIDIHVEDPHDENLRISKRITVAGLAKALSYCVAKPLYHCGMPITGREDDWDSCVADEVLQVAVFGESIYG